MKTRSLFLYLSITLSFIFITACSHQADNNLKKINIGGHELKIETMRTPQERAHGLSGRESLPQDQGMLFIFDNYSRPSFWMKEMNFPLDMIWVRDDTIIDISKNVPNPQSPDAPLSTYSPKSQVNYVIEVNAGWTDQYNIQIGDKVQF